VKFREIFRFEFRYQARELRTWLYFAVLFVVTFMLKRTGGGSEVHLNSPYSIAEETILASQLWALMAPAVAGSAAARDAQTRMHPLLYAAPISKEDYLGGRFLAAFLLNALILLAVPLAILAAMLLPGMDSQLVGPSWPAAYLSAYGVLSLPTAFAFTSVQFALAALKRRGILSYLASVLFFVTAGAATALVTNVLQMPALGKLLDPTCRMNVLVLMSDTLTPLEMNTVLIGLDASILANRLLWICLSSVVLVFTYNRFRFGYREG
jgi:ABC-type transport system involved in multi-copper enzyme maturation permease subunit